jgi:hypothetical protein
VAEMDSSVFQDMPKGAVVASALAARAFFFHSGTSTSLTSSAVVTLGPQVSSQSSPIALVSCEFGENMSIMIHWRDDETFVNLCEAYLPCS